MRPEEVAYRARVGGLAAAGLVAAHWLTYAAAVPAGAERHALLHDTGHALWPYVVAAAFAGFAAWAAAFVRDGHTIRPEQHAAAGTLAVARRLIVLQGAGWLALEAGERVVFGHGDGHWHLVALGLAVQVAVAVVGALLCRASARLLARLGARRPSRRRRHVRTVVLRIDLPRLARLGVGGQGLRGPPRTSTA